MVRLEEKNAVGDRRRQFDKGVAVIRSEMSKLLFSKGFWRAVDASR
jgi:hypothetical protein